MQNSIFSSIIGTLLFMLALSSAFGQRIVTGRVVNLHSKLPVENASVTVFKGTDFATTNDRGYFQMNLHDDDSLIFTHPDYITGGLKLPEADVFVIYAEQYNFYPFYLEGDVELYDYLMEQLKIPKKARNRAIEGILFVEMLIDSAGTLVSCSALNKLGANCEDELVEVFSNIPGLWSKSDVPYSKRLIFPIIIQMSNEASGLDVPQMKLPEGKLMRSITLIATADGQIVH
jgi:hypothetical protein